MFSSKEKRALNVSVALTERIVRVIAAIVKPIINNHHISVHNREQVFDLLVAGLFLFSLVCAKMM